GHHVVMTHNLTADEYRALFGLNKTTGLLGPRLFATRSAIGKARAQREGFREKLLEVRRLLTDDERAEYHRGRKMRLQQRLRPMNVETRHKISASVKATYALGVRQRSGPWLEGPPRDTVVRSH